MAPASGKEFLDIQANSREQIYSETRARMIITYSQYFATFLQFRVIILLYIVNQSSQTVIKIVKISNHFNNVSLLSKCYK